MLAIQNLIKFHVSPVTERRWNPLIHDPWSKKNSEGFPSALIAGYSISCQDLTKIIELSSTQASCNVPCGSCEYNTIRSLRKGNIIGGWICQATKLSSVTMVSVRSWAPRESYCPLSGHRVPGSFSGEPPQPPNNNINIWPWHAMETQTYRIWPTIRILGNFLFSISSTCINHGTIQLRGDDPTVIFTNNQILRKR